MADSRKVTVQFLGEDKSLGSTASGIEGKTSKVGASLKKFGIAAAAGLAVGAVAVTKGLYEIGSQFDDAYDKIRVGTGATGKRLDGLESDFKSVAKSVPSSLGDVSTSIADLNTRLGLSGKPLQNVSKQVLNLSRITGTDLSSNITSITRVFGDWGIKTRDMTGSMDKLFRASQATGLPVDQLAQSMTQFGGPMRQLGFDFDTTAALLGKFEKEGVNSNLVMGSMRIALGKMAKEGEPARETLMRVSKEIKNAGDASKANKIALELFGAKAGPDMAAAIREGRFSVASLVKTIGGGSDTIQKASDDTADFSEKWQLLKNRVMVGLEPLAMRVFNAFGTGMDLVGPKATQFAAWFQTRVSPALASFGATVQTKVVPAAQRFYSWFADKIAPAVRNFYAVRLAGLRSNLDSLQKSFQKNEPQLRQFGRWVRVAAEYAAKYLLPVLAKMSVQGMGRLTKAITVAVSAFALWVRWASFVGRAASNVVSAIMNAAAGFGRFAAAVREKVSAATKAVGSLPGRIKAAVGNLDNLLYGAGAAVIQGLINGVTSKISALTSKLHSITSLIPKHKGPIEKDRILLHGAGVAIMEGLIRGIQSGEKKLTDVLEKITDRVSKMKDKVAGLIAKRGGIVDSFKGMSSSVFGADSTKTVESVDPATGETTSTEVPTTVSDLLAFSKAQRDQANQLKADIAHLRKMGLSDALIKQFQAQGESGIANLHTLAGGTAADIGNLNAYDKATTDALGATGNMVAGYLGVNDQIKKAQRDEKAAARLEATLEKIEKHLGKDEVATVTIDNNAIVVAIRKEERKKGKKLLVSNP